MTYIQERGSTHVYHVNRMSKEEMDHMISLCVHEQPAYCVAACPFKADTKEMLFYAAKGNFKKALAIYEKITPFPMILCNGCTAPCEEKCRLCELGDGISIREVERAIVRYGEPGKRSSVFRIRKKKKAVIFGSGLFPLFLAGELEKKMYPATIYCQEKDYEAYIAAVAPELLESDRKNEVKRLSSMDLSFEFGCSLDLPFIRAKMKEADVVCASEEVAKKLAPEETADAEIMLREQAGIVSGPVRSVMDAAFAAKRAALTVDLLVQNLSPHSNRGSEGAVTTRLYTNMDGMKGSKKIPCSTDGYSKEEAVEEAKRCIQCHCDECMKSCVYLREYKKHPGLLAREIYNNTQIIMGDHQMNKPMNSCSLCGQCTVTCPNGFDMSQVCKSARENMVSTDKMPLAPHEFALMDMLFSNSEAFLCRPQPGYETCRYVFFPGCQAGAIAPDVVTEAYEDLCRRTEGGVALMLGCCGAISEWAGRYEMTEKVNEQLKQELAKLGDPMIIAGCPSCMKQLKESLGAKVTGIWEILKEIGLPGQAKGLELSLIHI